jgi:hypothetical protein
MTDAAPLPNAVPLPDPAPPPDAAPFANAVPFANAAPPPDAAPFANAVRPPDLAAELGRLEQHLGMLHARAAAAHQAWVNADEILRATLRRRDEVAAQLQFATSTWSTTTGPAAPPPAPAPRPAPAPAPTPASASGQPGAGPVREASTRTVQNLLFVLGGLLLGTAAIVFTAVAWATFGVQGRAMILAAVTLVMLSLPLLALWRKLRATAETFAAIGLLLIVLDGWAAYSVNLFGARDIPPNRYAGIACLATVVIAVGYGWVTRLAGPRFAALLAVQPMPLLLVVDSQPGLAVVSLTFGALALIDLGVVARHRASGTTAPQALALRSAAWVLCAIALSLAGVLAAASLITPADTPDAFLAAASLVAIALLVAAAAALSGIAALHAVAAAWVVLSIGIAGTRLVAFMYPTRQMVLLPAVVAAVSLLAVLARRGLRNSVAAGLIVGASVPAALCALAVAGTATLAGAQSLANVIPVWSADLATTPRYSWQLPAAIVLVAIAIAAPVPRRLWRSIAVVGMTLLALALPASFALAWWASPALDLVAAALLATIAATQSRARQTSTDRQSTMYRGFAALASASLIVHAAGASLARAELTAATLGGVVAIGLVLAFSGRVGDRISRAVRGGAFFAALTALAPAVGSWASNNDVSLPWVCRLTVGSLALVLAAQVAVRVVGASGHGLVWYAYAAAVAAALVWPTTVALREVEAPGVYAGIGLVALGAALAALPYRRQGNAHRQPAPAHEAQAAPSVPNSKAIPGHLQAAAAVALAAATPCGLLLLGAVAPSVFAVAAAPYSWLAAAWTGATGVGLTPYDEATAQPADAVALALLALAAALTGYALRRRTSSALVGGWMAAPTAVLVALVAASAPWPAVPAATLLIGLITIVAASIAAPGPARTTIAGVQATVYIGAGLGGMVALRWSTLAGLGLTVVATAIVGAVSRSVGWRVIGWLGTVGFGVATATAAVLAADLRLLAASYGVLAVAVLSLTLGATLGGLGRRREAIAVEAAAHASAVVALLYTIGWPMSAASICALWGIAVGLRALWPGTGRAARAAMAAVAAGFELLGWWLLLADRSVTITETYTVPLAGVALLAGWARLRAHPNLGSWLAYGPALGAAFLPSVAIVLLTSGNEARRLALGVGALAVVIAGSVCRLRAPVLIGGMVLLIMALHEVVVWWERVPGWIPLALGGVLLVGLAITYERRRRDLARLRAALVRMT